jgi:hypothetical protein
MHPINMTDKHQALPLIIYMNYVMYSKIIYFSDSRSGILLPSSSVFILYTDE